MSRAVDMEIAMSSWEGRSQGKEGGCRQKCSCSFCTMYGDARGCAIEKASGCLHWQLCLQSLGPHLANPGYAAHCFNNKTNVYFSFLGNKTLIVEKLENIKV